MYNYYIMTFVSTGAIFKIAPKLMGDVNMKKEENLVALFS